MKHHLTSTLRLLATLVVGASPALAQRIESITPDGPLWSEIKARVPSGTRAYLQWTHDSRPDAIWTNLGDSHRPSKRAYTFQAPRHEGLEPRFRIADHATAAPGARLFNSRRIAKLKIIISKADLAKVMAGVPEVDGVDGGTDGVGGPGNGGIDPGELPVDPGDGDDFPDGGEADPGSDPTDPGFPYVPISLQYDRTPLTRVGMRLKGNASLFFAALEKRKNVPFKLDFNRYQDGQRLDGIKKVNLHPVVSSPIRESTPDNPLGGGGYPGSFGLEEYLSYGAFREFGVPASRTGWVDLYINGESYGLYNVVEQMDSGFIDRCFGSSEGNVYKPETTHGGLEWQGAAYKDYADLNFKGGRDRRHRSILRLLDVINHQPVGDFPEVVDLQSVFNYTAGNVALGNWDTYEALGHNYLLYEGVRGRFVMLPWDLNLSQGLAGASIYGKTDSTEPVLGEEAVVKRPLTDGLYANPAFDARYLATLRAFLRGPGSVATLNARIDDAVALLGPRLDPGAIAALRDNIRNRVSELEAKLDAPPSP